jgi:hypothetical protein
MKQLARKYWYAVAVIAIVAAAAIGMQSSHILSFSAHKAAAQSAIPSVGLSLTWSGSKVQGVGLTMSGSGPFTENFQFAVCFQEQGRDNNRINCVHTPWAASTTPSDFSKTTPDGVPDNITSGNYDEWWSAWSASPEETIDGAWTTTITPPNGRVDNWQSSPTNGGEPNGCGLPGASNCSTCYDSKTCTGTGYSYDYGNGWTEVEPSLFVRTAPLPAGEIINNVQMGFEQLDDNDDNQMWNSNAAKNGPNLNDCANASLGRVVPWIITPLGGGSAVGSIGHGGGLEDPGLSYGYVFGDCDTGHIDGGGAQDYFRIYMSGSVYNANGISNNIPASFSTSESTTTGTDNNPLEITVQNTGGAAWTSNQSTVITGSAHGTCDGLGGTEPSPSDAQGAQCITSYNNYSNVFELKHVGGSFSVGTDPAKFDEVTQQACTVGGQECDDSSCSGDEEACTGSGYCSNGHDLDQGDCTDDGGTWTLGCNSTWENQISCSTTGGDPNVEPGTTTTFLLGSLTAPSFATTTTEIWQMENNGTPFGNQMSVSITVGASAPFSAGVVNVASEDSQTGSAVTSSFDVLDGASDLCGTSSCQAQNQNFNNIPLGIPVFVNAVPNSAGNSFAFGGVKERLPIAQKKTDILSNLFALSKSFFIGEANAQEYCAYIGTGSGCPAPVTMGTPGFGIDSLTPDNSIPADLTDNFVILWDPEASMSVSPSSVSNSLSTSGTVGTVTVSNSSTAPGAELGWSSSVSYTSGNNWLSVTPSADASGLEDGSSDTATIAYTGGLSPGTYHANVTIIGDPLSGGSLNPPSVTIPVTLTVTNGSGGPYFSCASNQCAETATPGATSCDAACGLPSGTNPAAKCAPNSITTAETSQCMLDLTGIPQNNVAWAIASGSSGSVNNSGVYTPSGTGTETIVGTLPDGTSADGTVTVTAPPLPTCNNASCQATCNSPTLNANPASIVVPESSSLTYGCSHVTECQLTGGGLPGFIVYPPPGLDTISGSVSTAPSITTTYTLTCVNGDYSSDSASASVQVTVGGSSLCEQNPNGAGCQGQ